MKPSEVLFAIAGLTLWLGGNIGWDAILVRDYLRWKDWKLMWVAIAFQVIANLIIAEAILDSMGK